MTAAPIAFRSSPGKYNFLGVASLVNAYAEQQGPDKKSQMAVLPCEGIKPLVDEATGPCRGMIYLADLDKLYTVHPSAVWRTEYDGTNFTSTRIGTVPGTNPVQISRNQNNSPQTNIVSDHGIHIVASDSVNVVLDGDLPDDPVTGEYIGGYTVIGYQNRKAFFSTIEDSSQYAALDFFTFEQRAGTLVRIVENAGEMIGFNDKWMEFWRKIDNQDLPFAPIGFRPRGLRAANGVVACDNTLMFPSDDNNVQRLNNYDPQVISDNGISRLIENDASASDIVGFGWNREGHAFASWTGSDWTRCYDAATQVWHSRVSDKREVWRAQFSVQAWGKTIVGDKFTGMLGYFDKDTFTEYGDPMVWGIDSPPMHVFPNGGIVDAVHFDFATGYGTLSGQGSNPKIMLQVSTDGGNTFGQYRELELGIRGKYATRVTARRLGRFGPKGIVFRLRVSDPVVRALANVDVEVRPLKR